jgi:hypothetical protein
MGAGNSPALQVRTSAFLFVNIFGPTALDRKMHEVCDRPADQERSGFSVFPTTDVIASDETVSAKRGGVGTVPIIPFFIACISYKFSFEAKTEHHTAVAWSYRPRRPETNQVMDPDGDALACPWTGADFHPADLDHNLIGSYAD